MISNQHKSRTNTILNSLLVAGKEWNIKYKNEEACIGLQNFYYIIDEPTQWIWSFSSPRSNQAVIDLLASFNHRMKLDDIRGGFGHMIYQCANNQHPEPVKNFDWEDQLSLLCLTYASTTKTFEISNQLKDGGHFIVINYRKKDEQDSYLRPFAIADHINTPMSVEELKTAYRRVREIDKVNHPEWLS